MKLIRITFVLLALLAPCARAVTPDAADAAIPDAALAARLEAIHQRAEKITSLRASFEQRKKTPMIKKPVISSGLVLVQGSHVLWESAKPRPMSLLMADAQVRIYFPEENAVEVFEIEDRLAQLASSPLPQLPILKQYFVIRELAAPTSAPAIDDALWLELTPADAALARHLKMVKVAVNEKDGTLRKLEMIDGDGGSTQIEFSNVEVNPSLKPADLQLRVREGAKESYPLGKRR